MKKVIQIINQIRQYRLLSFLLLLAILAGFLSLLAMALPEPPQTDPEFKGLLFGETTKAEVVRELGPARLDTLYQEHDTLFYPTQTEVDETKYYFDERGNLKLVVRGLPLIPEDEETLDSYRQRLSLGFATLVAPAQPDEIFLLHAFLEEGVGVVIHSASQTIYSYWFFQPGLNPDDFRSSFSAFLLPETQIGH